MSAEAEILSKRLDKLEETAEDNRDRLLQSARRLKQAEEHLSAHCTEIDDIRECAKVSEGHISRIEQALNQLIRAAPTDPVPLCPFCGEELHWAHYANDRPYLRCNKCGKTFLPPVLQPAGD